MALTTTHRAKVAKIAVGSIEERRKSVIGKGTKMMGLVMTIRTVMKVSGEKVKRERSVNPKAASIVKKRGEAAGMGTVPAIVMARNIS